MKPYRQADEGQAHIKGVIQLAAFAEKQHGQKNAVEGFQIVAETDGKGGNNFQYLYLKEIDADGADRRQYDQIPQIGGGRTEGKKYR